jgi:radical SAM/Cys-rich protein
MLATLQKLTPSDFPPLRRGRLETLQVNLGYRCNQQCLHCHVNASPNRREVMEPQTVDAVLALLERRRIERLDLTGGAPELNPDFRRLVTVARALGCHVIDRCNLTILEEPQQEDLADFLATEQVEIVASMPCYLEENVDAQRGNGTYAKSIRALRRLNALGYGRPGSGLTLTLVYNPGGAFLPPEQSQLESDYRRELAKRHGVVFTRLFTLTNMPIARFGSTLLSKGELDAYLRLLKSSMRPANLEGVMCRSLVSVDWRGHLYDCDFNQMLGLPLRTRDQAQLHLEDLLDTNLEGNPIVVADHCYGCTAGQGSSCGGALE